MYRLLMHLFIQRFINCKVSIMKASILLAVLGLLTTTFSYALIKNAKTAIIKVYGNCGISQIKIEKAGSKSKLYKTNRDVDTNTNCIYKIIQSYFINLQWLMPI